MQNIELTQAELELITIKREKEALAEREAQAKKQADLEKRIQEERDRANKEISKDKEQILACRRFDDDFDGASHMRITKYDDTKVVKDYVDGKWVDVWSETFKRENAYITVAEPGIGTWTIKVEEHTVHKNWSSINKGYKMFLSGPNIQYQDERRAYSNAKSVLNKIYDCIEAITAERRYEAKKKTAVTDAMERMKTEYPNASIRTNRETVKTFGNNYETYDFIYITLENGIEIQYRANVDGSLIRGTVKFNVNDNWNLLNILNSINIPADAKVSK